jgi:hypothetical protein
MKKLSIIWPFWYTQGTLLTTTAPFLSCATFWKQPTSYFLTFFASLHKTLIWLQPTFITRTNRHSLGIFRSVKFSISSKKIFFTPIFIFLLFFRPFFFVLKGRNCRFICESTLMFYLSSYKPVGLSLFIEVFQHLAVLEIRITFYIITYNI